MELNLSLPSVGAAFANKMLAQPGVFDDRATLRRIIAGVATTNRRNENGRVFDPESALIFDMPIPLLFNHDWKIPCGRVTKVKPTPEALFFEARVIDGVLPWAQKCWEHLKSGDLPALSVHGWGQDRWRLFEISVCEVGACPGAIIHTVKSALNPHIAYLDGRPRETIHWDARPSRKGVQTATQSARASA